MVEQEKYNKETMYNDLDKYTLAYSAKEAFDKGNAEEGEDRGKAYLLKTSSLEELVEKLEISKTPFESIVAPHDAIYRRKLHELKVPDALEYLKAPEELKKDFEKYSANTLKDLVESANKYNEAFRKYIEAKTKEESTEAFDEKKQYEETAKDYSEIAELILPLVEEKSASDIANYKRRKVVINRKKRKEAEAKK